MFGHQKPDFKGNARSSAVGFSIGNKGYIGTGFGGNFLYILQDFWEYDPSLSSHSPGRLNTEKYFIYLKQ